MPLYVIACLLALSTNTSAQSQVEAQKSNSQPPNDQAEQPKLAPKQLPIHRQIVDPQDTNKRQSETKAYQPNCGKPENQPDADLCTQRRVADAAEKTLQYTLAQTVIGGLGVFFVVMTLGFTARANRAASIAAQAAMDAIGFERAWMTIAEVECEIVQEDCGNGKTKIALTVAAQWRNSGRSPAISAELSGLCATYPAADDLIMYNFPNYDGIATSIVGPGIYARTLPQSISYDELNAVLNGDRKLIIASKIWYKTTSDRSNVKFTEYVAEAIIPHRPARVEDLEGRHFRFVQVGTQQSGT